jgi:hypothetical protein
VNLYAFCNNDPVNGMDGLGLWWWDAELIEDGLGGLLGFYGLENTRACWQGSGMLSVESAAIYFNELSFGLLDSSGLTFTHEYKTAEHQAARGVGRITRTVEVGLASQGALSTTYASLAVAGGKTALYGTTAVRAGVTALALNSANQNSGSAVDTYAAGHTGDAIGYSILSVLDMYSAANLMWQSRPMVDVPSQKYGPYVDQKVRGAVKTASQAVTQAQDNWTYGHHKTAQKIHNQMQRRGWTPQQINEAMASGNRIAAPNQVNSGNTATRYIHPTTGRSVVVDDVTHEVLHVGGDGFRY